MIVAFVAPNEVDEALEKKPLVAKRLVEVAFVAVRLVMTAVRAEISVAKNEVEVAFCRLVFPATVTLPVTPRLVVVAFVETN